MSSYRSPHVPYVYITPAALVTIVALLYPIVEAIKIGFFEWGMGTPWETARWVGLEAFGAAMVDEQVWVSIGITLAFVFLAITVEMVLGVGLALLLESPVRGMRLFRTAFVLPMMVAPICVGLIWRYMLDAQFGPINHLMSALGLPPQEWLASPWLAFGAMVVTDVWQWTAFVFIMVLAALQGVEASVTEASRIDGASWWQQIWMVKLPIIRPLLIVTLLMRMVDGFRGLEVIYVMTFGGPGMSTELLSLHIYKAAFVSQKLGHASVLSVLLLAIVTVLSIVILQLSNPLAKSKIRK